MFLTKMLLQELNKLSPGRYTIFLENDMLAVNVENAESSYTVHITDGDIDFFDKIEWIKRLAELILIRRK